MKIIATSDLTIYDELRKVCDDNKVLIDKKVALKIEAIKITNEEYKRYAREFGNIIFQSKNAVSYSNDIHNYLLSNKKSKMYCLGKFTMIEIRKFFRNKIEHPENNYSSESLLDLIKRNSIKSKDYLIIKGEGGRDNFKESIEEALDMSIYLTATLLETSDKKAEGEKSERKTWQADDVIIILSGLHKLYSSKYAENQLDLCTKIDDIIRSIKKATKWSEEDEKTLI